MLINVKITPNNKKQEIKKVKSLLNEEIYQIKLKSKPENGKANKELIKFLANYFKVSEDKIKIISGKTSRNKKILIKE